MKNLCRIFLFFLVLNFVSMSANASMLSRFCSFCSSISRSIWYTPRVAAVHLSTNYYNTENLVYDELRQRYYTPLDVDDFYENVTHNIIVASDIDDGTFTEVPDYFSASRYCSFVSEKEDLF